MKAGSLSSPLLKRPPQKRNRKSLAEHHTMKASSADVCLKERKRDDL
jgi:hypothetical protein